MGYKRETVELLRKFRKNLGSDLFQEDSKRIFKATLTELPVKESNPICDLKMQFARNYIQYLKVLNLIKFIGVSGSVAAGIAKEEDDIDFFVVVKNNTMWIYRGLMLLKSLFNRKFRRASDEHSGKTKDLICVNFIAEERGLKLDNDIFNLHELYYLKPIYNENYYETLLSANQWLKEWGGVVVDRDYSLKKQNILLEAINLYFFLPQLLYTIISRHKIEFKRLIANYSKGRIEYFPSNYKQEKIKLLDSI